MSGGSAGIENPPTTTHGTAHRGSSGMVRTLRDVPSEDAIVIGSTTQWYVAWELLMVGPFTSCALLDGEHVRHVTVATMARSAVQRDLGAAAILIAADYPVMPALSASMRLADAAVLVVADGWDLAVVMDDEPRVISACNVLRGLLVDDGGRRRDADPFDSWRCEALNRQVALAGP